MSNLARFPLSVAAPITGGNGSALSISDATVDARGALTSAHYALLANAGQANGVALYDGTGALVGKFIVRFGTAAEINAIVLDPGELAITTDTHEMRLGDGATSGGWRYFGSTFSVVRVRATGTAVENGTLLRNGYTLAKALTPNGAALAATNRATLDVDHGVYTITAAGANWSLDTPYVDLIGAGSRTTYINVNNSNKIAITLANIDHVLKGFRIYNSDGASALTFAIPNSGTTTVWHEDLWFYTGSATIAAMAMTGTSATLAGRLRRVVTDGKSLYGALTGLTISADIEFCEAGDTSFSGNSATGNSGSLTGTVTNTRNFSSTWNGMVNGKFLRNDWSPAIVRVGSSAEIKWCDIRGASSGVSIGNLGNAVNAKIAHCNMPGTIGNGVTNLLSATLDGAANVVDSDST